MIYEYKCGQCQIEIQVERSIHAEASEPTCSECKVLMNRVWGLGGITFNGSGFYSTDNPK